MKTPIVFAINESYYKQLETVIVSILENSQSNFEFIVLSKGLPEFCKDAIGKTISLYGDRSSARFIDLSKVKNINIESLMSGEMIIAIFRWKRSIDFISRVCYQNTTR